MVHREVEKRIKGLEPQMALERRSVRIGEISIGGNPSLLDVPILDSKGDSGGF